MTIQFSQVLEGFKRFQSFRANRWSPDLKPNIDSQAHVFLFFLQDRCTRVLQSWMKLWGLPSISCVYSLRSYLILSYIYMILYADESIARNSPTIHSEKKIHNVEVARWLTFHGRTDRRARETCEKGKWPGHIRDLLRGHESREHCSQVSTPQIR